MLDAQLRQWPDYAEEVLTPLKIVVAETDYISKIAFIVGVDGNMNIEFDWTTLSDTEAAVFSELLYEINNGMFVGSIAKTMIDITLDKPELEPFIRNILLQWSEIEEIGDDAPIVKPSEVLRLGRDKLGE